MNMRLLMLFLTSITRSLCWSSLLVCFLAPGTETVRWLQLTQTSPPSQVETLRSNISTFVESARRKILGTPGSVLTTAYFVSVSPAGSGQNFLPVATSTNSDGTIACILSAGQLQAFLQTIRLDRNLRQFAAPSTMAIEGNRASISVSRGILINGASASYGPRLDIIYLVRRKAIELRAIATVTQAVTNLTAVTAEIPEHNPVSITTVFQSGIDARVPNGGGLAVWNRANRSEHDTCLMIICPIITTNFATQYRTKP